MNSEVRQWLARSIMGVMMLWFLGDLVMFPDAPIHRCAEGGNYAYTHHPDGYCGKQGQAHTSVDFVALSSGKAACSCFGP